MKTTEKIVISLAITTALIFAGAIGAFVSQVTSPVMKAGGVSAVPAVSFWTLETATSSVVALSTDLRLLSTSSKRQFVYISAGQGCSQGFYVSMANDLPATASNSHFVASSSSFEINTVSKPYMGSIRAVSNGGTCNVNVTSNAN